VWPKSGGGNLLSDAGAALVQELARVGWDVPGIDVKFWTLGQGKNVFRTVYAISGVTREGPFKITFSNPQQSRGHYRALTGLGEATIPPGIEVRYYNDDSTVTATLYTGGDWKRDGANFINKIKVNSKLRGEPKTYLKYQGHSWNELKHDTDLGREYSPERDEPKSLDAKATLQMVADFIHGSLIPSLAQMPSAPGHDDINEYGDANLRRLAKVSPIEAPEDFPVLYSWIRIDDAYRALGRGTSSPDGSDDFVLSGGGARLVAWGDNPHGAKLHPRAHDGFAYASTDPSVRAAQASSSVREESVPVEVRLKNLNEIYVVDNAPYRKVREEIGKQLDAEERDRFTHAECARMVTAVAETMVHVTDYDGSFEQPTYLIGRQLHADEARVMRGEVKLHVTEDRIHATLTDEESDVSMNLCDYKTADGYAVNRFMERRALRIAERVADLFNAEVTVDRECEFPEPEQTFSL
jgi:hypothetical protein